ncbi:MAG: choice-of-anchor D domain-containing protein [Bacteroidales bacterium]|nr:choice-of-anchor D domain-containing protein [Bacteroidales bacterium]
MSKKVFTLMSLLWLASSLIAQEAQFEWAVGIGGVNDDYGQSVAVDASGNVYTTGYFQGTVDFDPGSGSYNLSSNGGADIFISKLDASGNFVWAKNMGGSSSDVGYSIAIDASGNVYTTGSFQGSTDFDPGSGTHYLSSNGYYDIFISKLDASGNFIWAKNMGGFSSDEGISIAIDASGNVYTTGHFNGIVDFDPGSGSYNLSSYGSEDIFISKLDASGNFVWAKNMGGSSLDWGYSIAIDASENVYVSGKFYGTVDFDPGSGSYNLSSNDEGDIFISKLDASGNFVWAKNMGGSSYDWGYSIAIDASGNVYTTGIFQGTADFDPGSGSYNLSSNGSDEIFISKLDASGNFVWAKNMGGSDFDYGYSIAIDASGNVYTTGIFEGTADFDPGSGLYSLSSNGDADIFISKLDASGNFVWAKNMGGSSSDYGNSIALDASGNVYTTGFFYGTVDFDPDIGSYSLSSNGSADIFILKLSQAQALQANFTSSDTTIVLGDTFQFTDLSTGNPTSWLWDFGDGTTSTTQNPTHVYQNAGIYSVSLLVSNGSSSDTLIMNNYITVISTLELSYLKTDNQCFGENNGAINLSVSGGIPPYTFAWSTGAATEDAVGLSAGLYSFTVSDAGGSTLSESIEITQPAEISQSVSASVCEGETYIWQGNTYSQAGTYYASYLSVNGCDSIFSLHLSILPVPIISSVISDVTTVGGNNGGIDISVTGGSPSYNYVWSNGLFDQDLTGLTAGTYSVTVTDVNNCQATESFSVEEPLNCLPAISLSHDTLDFGLVETGSGMDTLSVWVSNTGNCALAVDSLFGLSGPFSLLYPAGFSVPAGDSVQVPVLLNQSYQAGSYIDTLNISSNATQNINLESGLVAYYPFNGNANDESGNNFNGTPMNSYSYVSGIDDGAIRIQGTGYVSSDGGHVLIPYQSFNSLPEFSISLWVKEEGMSHEHGCGYIFFGDNSSSWITIAHFGTYLQFRAGDSDVSIPYENSWLNNWVNFSLVYNDGILQAFENSLPVGSDSGIVNLTYNYSAFGRTWWYGGGGTGTRFIGSIDEARIYNRALSLAEIQALYNQNTALSNVAQVIVKAELLNPQQPEIEVQTTSLAQFAYCGEAIIDSIPITNNGNDTLEVTITESLPCFFVSNNVTSILPGQTVNLQVNFDGSFPSGNYSGNIEIHSNDISNPLIVLPVSFTIACASCQLSANSINFGQVVINQTGASQNFVINNSGNADLIIDSIALEPGSPFSIQYSPIIIPAGAPGYSVMLGFNPSNIGSYSGQVTVYSNGQNLCSLQLSGEGVSPSASWTVSANHINVGLVPVNSTQSVAITVTNTGNIDLPLNCFIQSGLAFSVLPNEDTLQTGSSLVLNVGFSPSAIQSYTGYLVLIINGNSQTISLTGSGYVPSNSPVLSFDSNLPYSATSGVSPTQGPSSTYFEYHIVYSDADNNPPMSGFPKLGISAANDGSFAQPGDYLITLMESDPADVNYSDGKLYQFTTQLNIGQYFYQFMASDNLGNPATGQGISFTSNPMVSNDLLDVSIFANDINFSIASPVIGDQVTISATIHNNSDYPAQNVNVYFYVKDTLADTRVIPVLQANSQTTVSIQKIFTCWDFYPVKVVIQALPGEADLLDNSAIRPIIVGNVILPGSIAVSGTGISPSTVYPGNTLNFYGHVQYNDVPGNPSVEGAAVTMTIQQTGEVFTSYTNSGGNFSVYFPAPYNLGNYSVSATITDYTLSANTPVHTFAVIPVPFTGGNSTSNPLLPDLRIQNNWLTIQNNCLITNEVLNLQTFIMNSGDTATSGFLVTIYLDGDSVTSKMQYPLNPSQGRLDTFNILLSSPGTHTISVFVDALNLVSESIEHNNMANKMLVVYDALPDLIPLDISFSDNSPGIGQPVQLSCLIKNQSCLPANSTDALLMDMTTGLVLDNIQIPSLAGSEEYQINVPNVIFSSSGYHLIKLELDPNHQVSELSETNNSYTEYVLIDVSSSELWATNLRLNSNQSISTTSISFKVDIHNTGTMPADSFYVCFYAGNNRIGDSILIESLSPDSVISLISDEILKDDCPQDISVIADVYETILEQNEYNNRVSRMFGYDVSLVNFYPGNSVQNPIQVLAGSYQSLSAYVKNTGNYEMFDVSYSIILDGGLLVTGEIPYLGQNSQALTELWTSFPSAGDYVYYIFADSLWDDTIPYCELNEGNNLLSIYVHVYENQPDLVVRSEYISPSVINPDVSDSVWVNVTVKNEGLSSAGQFWLTLKGNDTLLGDTLWVNSLNPGNDITLPCLTPFIPSTNGISVLELIANGNHMVEESNYANNAATRSLIVGAAPDFSFDSLECVTLTSMGANLLIRANLINQGNEAGLAQVNFYRIQMDDTIQIAPPQFVFLGANSSGYSQITWQNSQLYSLFFIEIGNVQPLESDIFNNTCFIEYGEPYAPLVSSVSISHSFVCPEESVTVFSYPQNGMGNYGFKWFKNGILLSQQSQNISLELTEDATITVEISDDSVTHVHSVEVIVYETLEVSALIQDVSCFNATDGSIIPEITGDTTSISWDWSNQVSSLSNQQLGAGIYSLSVMDANGCSSAYDWTIYQPDVLELITSISHMTQTESNDGEILISTVGGSSPYFYNWSNGMDSAGIDSLSAGYYTVTVTDINQCSLEESFEVLTVASQNIQLNQDWNLISSYIIPGNPAINQVLASISNTVLLVKNGQGLIYWPQYSVNQIGNLILGQAYQIKVTQNELLSIHGWMCNPDLNPITINQSWNLLGYLRNSPAPITHVFDAYSSMISLAKNGLGQVYWPAYGVNLIGDMLPGNGYQLKANSVFSFTYPANSILFSKTRVELLQTKHFSSPKNTGNNMTLGIINSGWAKKGDEIGVFDSAGLLVGSSVVNGSLIVLTIWGDDELSVEKDGLFENEPYNLFYKSEYAEDSLKIFISEWEFGNENYLIDGISMGKSIQFHQDSMEPIQFFAYPNPFNDKSTLVFTLPENQFVEIELVNLLGEKIKTVVSQDFRSGNYEVEVDATGLASGTYFAILRSGNYIVPCQLFIN